jgi:hypothetical protein
MIGFSALAGDAKKERTITGINIHEPFLKFNLFT